MKKHHFFAMLSRMKYINRWGLMRNTREENLSEHSHEVALIAQALAIIGNKRLGKSYNTDRAAALGLIHDAPEIITGDLPTPVKYHSKGIREAYKEVEDLAGERLVSMLPDDFKEEYRAMLLMSSDEDKELKPIIKAADKISAVIKCMEEKKSGNTEFEKAEQTLVNTIHEMDLEEAEIFMQEFLPSYGLTLDELD